VGIIHNDLLSFIIARLELYRVIQKEEATDKEIVGDCM
jgi:hypothetical protein